VWALLVLNKSYPPDKFWLHKEFMKDLKGKTSLPHWLLRLQKFYQQWQEYLTLCALAKYKWSYVQVTHINNVRSWSQTKSIKEHQYWRYTEVSEPNMYLTVRCNSSIKVMNIRYCIAWNFSTKTLWTLGKRLSKCTSEYLNMINVLKL